MKALNIELTTSFEQFPDQTVNDVDFVADPTNSGTVIISLAGDENIEIDRLAAGDSFWRETSFNLSELQARSTSSGDKLFIRW